LLWLVLRLQKYDFFPVSSKKNEKNNTELLTIQKKSVI